MSRRTVLPLALVVASGLVGLAGCGGDDEASAPSASAGAPTTASQPATVADTPTTEASPTTTAAPASAADHDRFIAELNAICLSGNTRLRTINIEAQASGSLKAAARSYAKAARLYASLLRSVRALEVPAEDQEAFADYVRAGTRSSGLVDRLADAAASGRSVGTIQTAIEEASKDRLTAAVDLGADECGQNAE